MKPYRDKQQVREEYYQKLDTIMMTLCVIGLGLLLIFGCALAIKFLLYFPL